IYLLNAGTQFQLATYLAKSIFKQYKGVDESQKPDKKEIKKEIKKEMVKDESFKDINVIVLDEDEQDNIEQEQEQEQSEDELEEDDGIDPHHALCYIFGKRIIFEQTNKGKINLEFIASKIYSQNRKRQIQKAKLREQKRKKDELKEIRLKEREMKRQQRRIEKEQIRKQKKEQKKKEREEQKNKKSQEKDLENKKQMNKDINKQDEYGSKKEEEETVQLKDSQSQILDLKSDKPSKAKDVKESIKKEGEEEIKQESEDEFFSQSDTDEDDDEQDNVDDEDEMSQLSDESQDEIDMEENDAEVEEKDDDEIQNLSKDQILYILHNIAQELYIPNLDERIYMKEDATDTEQSFSSSSSEYPIQMNQSSLFNSSSSYQPPQYFDLDLLKTRLDQPEQHRKIPPRDLFLQLCGIEGDPIKMRPGAQLQVKCLGPANRGGQASEDTFTFKTLENELRCSYRLSKYESEQRSKNFTDRDPDPGWTRNWVPVTNALSRLCIKSINYPKFGITLCKDMQLKQDEKHLERDPCYRQEKIDSFGSDIQMMKMRN
ncbi:MAG: hypothetical protein EZS28_036013, partial [Streblomastix strix]